MEELSNVFMGNVLDKVSCLWYLSRIFRPVGKLEGSRLRAASSTGRATDS